MDKIELTYDELEQVFSMWYSEYGYEPEEFVETDNDGKNGALAFIDYLEKVRTNK